MVELNNHDQEDAPKAATFSYGDLVILEDHKKRRTMVKLEEHQKIHTHVGIIDADRVVGRLSGTSIQTSTDKRIAVLHPLFEDFVFHMPRAAQVIYPKDLAAIIFRLNLRPGDHVLESGVGSGALSCALLRGGAIVTALEAREDFANLAKKNVANYLGPQALERYDIRIGSIYLGAPGGPYAAVVLDLPEPWEALQSARSVISQDGVLCVYVTNVTQLVRVSEALGDAGFGYSEAVELLERQWYLNGVVARPQHRMVGHTGFILTARPIGLQGHDIETTSRRLLEEIDDGRSLPS